MQLNDPVLIDGNSVVSPGWKSTHDTHLLNRNIYGGPAFFLNSVTTVCFHGLMDF